MGLLNKDNEKKIGNCPWCGNHNVQLTFVIGQYNGHLWSGWICGECLGEKTKDWLGEQKE